MDSKLSNASNRAVIGFQYFIHFGVMGIYLPYFYLYCFHLDFSGFQIGVLSALRSLALILFPLLWGILADRFQIRRPIYILCNILSTAIWGFYLFTTDFRIMALITVFYAIFHAPIISFLEAFTMDILAQQKKSYGRIRVWGSISFILTVIVIGKVIDNYSIDIILVLILFGSLLKGVVSFKLPAIRSDRKQPFISGAKPLLKKHVIVFLFCGFLMLASHGTYYGFFSIHLEGLGYGNTFIGISWAVAVITEIVIMITSQKMLKRYYLENVLLYSFMAAVLRWFVLFLFRSPIIILLSQMLHAFSYGTFHIASILYMDRLAPDEAKTVGQAVNNAVSYGLGLMVGFLVNGYLYERVGSYALFGISGLIALAGGFLLKGSLPAKNRLAEN